MASGPTHDELEVGKLPRTCFATAWIINLNEKSAKVKMCNTPFTHVSLPHEWAKSILFTRSKAAKDMKYII